MHQRGFPTNQKSGRPHVTLSFTEAPLMRLSVGSLRQMVKRDLPIEFVPQQLTSYGGLELFRRYVRRLDLHPRLRRACADLGGDYCGGRLSLLLLALFYVGARRVEHVKYLIGDPLVRRFCGLARIPTARTVTNWLRRFTPRRSGPSSGSMRRSCSTPWRACRCRGSRSTSMAPSSARAPRSPGPFGASIPITGRI